MTQPSALARIGRRFDARALAYDRNPISRWVGGQELSAIRDLAPLSAQPGQTAALDFGCGTGRVTELLLAMGYRVTGYDISPGMLALAHQRFAGRGDVSLTADAQSLGQGWPLIVALGVLDYYPQTDDLWRQWASLLAEDGVLVITAPNGASPLARLYAFASRWTCQAYPATLPVLTVALGRVGLRLAASRAVFPAHPRFGHTLVLRAEWAG